MKEDDFKQVAMFIDEGVQLGIEAKAKAGMWDALSVINMVLVCSLLRVFYELY